MSGKNLDNVKKLWAFVLKNARRNGRHYSLEKGRLVAIDLSQSELAAKIGVNRSYIARLESGKVAPTLEMIDKIAAALDIPLAELFGAIDDLRRQNFLREKQAGTLYEAVPATGVRRYLEFCNPINWAYYLPSRVPSEAR